MKTDRLAFSIAAGALLSAAMTTTLAANLKENSMTTRATGPFDVKVSPLEPYNNSPDGGLGRMSIDKQFHGTLEATSKGEMLCTPYKPGGSGGYVAMERVSGTLAGRKGTFVFQHSSIMVKGVPEQNVFVVPDSGTGELEGLSGRMTIVMAAGGAHSYEFDYSLPPKP